MNKLTKFQAISLIVSIMAGIGVFSANLSLAIGAQTEAATNIVQNGALLRGTVTAGSANYIYAFAVSPSASFTEPVYAYSGACTPNSQVIIWRGQVSGGLSGSNPVTLNLSTANASCSYQPNSTYYFKLGVQDPIDNACVWSTSCYQWGTVESFTTRSAILPTVVTSDPSNIGPDSVTLNGLATANDMYSNVSFEYGLKSDLSDAIVNKVLEPVNAGSTPTSFSKSIKGLVESTTYFYRAVISNLYGTSRGTILSFATRAPVGLSINDAADFTNAAKVELAVSWPTTATSMLISNDGGFRSQKAFPLSERVDWELISSGDERLPKTVYMKFILNDGTRSAALSDDIILDTTAPVITKTSGTAVSSAGGVTVQSITAKLKNAVKLVVASKDGNSGIAMLQVRTSKTSKITEILVNKTGKVTTSSTLRTTKKTIYVRVMDRAGNPSSGWKLTRVK